MGGEFLFEPRIAGYDGRRMEFRRRGALNNRDFRRVLLSISDTRESLTGLGWELGQRPTDWDRCGCERWPEGGGLAMENFGRGREWKKESGRKERSEGREKEV